MSRVDEIDEGDFDLHKDDGWTNVELADRAHLDPEGRYLGPKDEVQ